MAPGDLLDVLNRPPDAVWDGNPRRTAHLGSQGRGTGEGRGGEGVVFRNSRPKWEILGVLKCFQGETIIERERKKRPRTRSPSLAFPALNEWVLSRRHEVRPC